MRKKRTLVEKKIESPESTIYIGPNLPKGKLSRFTVFKSGTVQPHVQSLINQNPCLKFLIVPVSNLSASLQKLSDSASVESAKFAEALKIKGA